MDVELVQKVIPGTPYSGLFKLDAHDGGEFRDARLAVSPPFIGSDLLYEMVTSGSVRIKHYTTVESASILSLTCHGNFSSAEHADRLLASATELVDELNEMVQFAAQVKAP